MNKVIDAKINMFDNVDYELQRNPTIVDTSPAFRVMTDFLHTELAEIRQLVQTLLLTTTGLAERKAKAKNEASLLLSCLCGAIRSYAATSNNDDLYRQADLSYTDLKETRDPEFPELADALYALAESVQPQLVDYGVTVQSMAGVLAAINLFKTYNVEPRAAKVTAKTNRYLLYKRVWSLNDYLVERMDNVVLMLRMTHPEFYELYHNARRNYTLGVRHEQPEPAFDSQELRAMKEREAEMQDRLKMLRKKEAMLKKQEAKLQRLEDELKRLETEAAAAENAAVPESPEAALRALVEEINEADELKTGNGEMQPEH